MVHPGRTLFPMGILFYHHNEQGKEMQWLIHFWKPSVRTRLSVLIIKNLSRFMGILVYNG
jgi:hypothetical protein